MKYIPIIPLIPILCLAVGCGTLPVTGPLTAVSAGIAPEEAVRVEAGEDGNMSGHVGAFTVKKRKGAMGTLLHYGLMAAEMYGYYILADNLLEDDGSDPIPIDDDGGIDLSGAKVRGSVNAQTLGASVDASDAEIEGNLTINTGPAPQGDE